MNLPAGTVLAEKYRVSRVIGVGGMGVVVAAEHLGLGSMVAIKIMRPELIGNENIVKRFMFEGKAATRLQSDYVARVLDVGHLTGEGIPEGGVPYLVMEYLKGHDLSEWVRSGRRFSVHEAVHYVSEAAEALQQAHKAGIIHRDVKPANLFLAQREGAEPSVKILDFGISKLLDEQTEEMGLTKTTAVLGSGLYMSPEQMRSSKNVDQRTDIYALGVCLYELLSGTQPFVAETFSELCVKVNVEDPTPLRDHRSDVSEEQIGRASCRERV
jgi:serine/threonine-protein kinase